MTDVYLIITDGEKFIETDIAKAQTVFERENTKDVTPRVLYLTSATDVTGDFLD